MVSQTLHVPVPAEESPAPVAKNRTRRLLQGATSTMLSKGVALAVSAISIPITVRYLGPKNFGVWVTISIALTMLLVLDLGVANSLTNFISEAYARDDRNHARTYTTTALGVVCAVALFVSPSIHRCPLVMSISCES